jgi:hypothetical protein
VAVNKLRLTVYGGKKERIVLEADPTYNKHAATRTATTSVTKFCINEHLHRVS